MPFSQRSTFEQEYPIVRTMRQQTWKNFSNIPVSERPVDLLVACNFRVLITGHSDERGISPSPYRSPGHLFLLTCESQSNSRPHRKVSQFIFQSAFNLAPCPLTIQEFSIPQSRSPSSIAPALQRLAHRLVSCVVPDLLRKSIDNCCSCVRCWRLKPPCASRAAVGKMNRHNAYPNGYRGYASKEGGAYPLSPHRYAGSNLHPRLC